METESTEFLTEEATICDLLFQAENVVVEQIENLQHDKREHICEGFLMILRSPYPREDAVRNQFISTSTHDAENNEMHENHQDQEITEHNSSTCERIVFLVTSNVTIPLIKSTIVLGRADMLEYVFCLPGNTFVAFTFTPPPHSAAAAAVAESSSTESESNTEMEAANTFEETIEEFVKLLKQQCTLRWRPETAQTKATSSRFNMNINISKEAVGKGVITGIDVGSKKVASLISSGSTVLSTKIASGGEYVKERVVPRDTPVPVHPTVMKAVEGTRACTKTAYYVTSELINFVVSTASNVVVYAVSGPVKKITAGDDNAEPGFLKQVAVTTVEGAMHIIDVGTDSLTQIVETSSKTASSVVAHKYGQPFGELSKQTLGIAKDVGYTVLTVKSVGVKKIAARIVKRSAIETAKLALDVDSSTPLKTTANTTATATTSECIESAVASEANDITPVVTDDSYNNNNNNNNNESNNDSSCSGLQHNAITTDSFTATVTTNYNTNDTTDPYTYDYRHHHDMYNNNDIILMQNSSSPYGNNNHNSSSGQSVTLPPVPARSLPLQHVAYGAPSVPTGQWESNPYEYSFSSNSNSGGSFSAVDFPHSQQQQQRPATMYPTL